MSTLEQMRLDLIQRIIENLKNVSYPLSFDATLYRDVNCMAYAIGIKVPDTVNHEFYFPGAISNNAKTLIPEKMIENFIKDMQVLGISAETISRENAKEPSKNGIQTVALFYSWKDNDFHFIRKDKEGGWSHKIGYKKAPCKAEYKYEKFFERKDCYIVYDLVAFFNLSFL